MPADLTQTGSGTAPDRGFPDEEFQQRIANAQGRMAKAGLDVLLLTSEADVRYFSGFLTQFWESPTRPWFLLVPAKGKPVAVIPEIGRICMEATWIDDIRTWDSPNPDDEGIAILAEAVREFAGKQGNIGTPMGAESHLRMPISDFRRLEDFLGGFRWTDCTWLIRELRVIKSEREIRKIEHACKIASMAFDVLGSLVSPGMTEISIFREFKHKCLEYGADDIRYLVGGTGSGGYSDIISPPTEKSIASGDVLILDTGLVWDGYFCDFDRNYSIGKPSKPVTEAYDILWDVTQTGMEAARAGTTCREVFEVMAQALPNCQQSGVGRFGHGLGMQLTEHPSIAAFDETVLEPGMVLTLEPGYEFAPGKIMVHEENIVIRKNGPELLSKRAASNVPVIDF